MRRQWAKFGRKLKFQRVGKPLRIGSIIRFGWWWKASIFGKWAKIMGKSRRASTFLRPKSAASNLGSFFGWSRGWAWSTWINLQASPTVYVVGCVAEWFLRLGLDNRRLGWRFRRIIVPRAPNLSIKLRKFYYAVRISLFYEYSPSFDGQVGDKERLIILKFCLVT